MIRVSDYIADFLQSNNIKHIFTVTGGGAMHLNDAFGKHPGLSCIYNHHEQACAMAAESYTRLTGKIAAVCVTSGPGGTNAITGVLGGWLDSIPMLIISGQVKYNTTVRSTGLALRQFGDQEFDITTSVANMTKYAQMVTDPLKIRYHLEKALYLAMAGRPGPCWLDIPLNVQSALIDADTLERYDALEDTAEVPPEVTKGFADKVIQIIEKAERPVLLIGTGVRLSGAVNEALKLIELLDIPVVTAFNAHDIIPSDHPLYVGRQGTIGDRAGNFAVQNSDLLLILGCRLNIRQIGYNWGSFAREAYKVMVDIDPVEFNKTSFNPDLAIHADCRDFIAGLVEAVSPSGLAKKAEWADWCLARKKKYPIVLDEYWHRDNLVNPYCFMEALSTNLKENDIIVTANATACICAFQTIKIKRGQRLYSNSGCASMGYGLPAAIGACVGSGYSDVVCLAGDGSIQMNLQELQTIVHNKFPIKIFVLNNNGYHSIRQTQSNYFGRPLVGCEPNSGVSFPDMERIAYAYGIPFIRCSNHAQLDESVKITLASEGAFVCEIMLTPDQPFAPRSSSVRLPDGSMISRPLEDLAPFLNSNELKDNMMIDTIPELDE